MEKEDSKNLVDVLKSKNQNQFLFIDFSFLICLLMFFDRHLIISKIESMIHETLKNDQGLLYIHYFESYDQVREFPQLKTLLITEFQSKSKFSLIVIQNKLEDTELSQISINEQNPNLFNFHRSPNHLEEKAWKTKHHSQKRKENKKRKSPKKRKNSLWKRFWIQKRIILMVHLNI
jgi:hypothetical protein